jgi:pimeloyl-ACP methyl ester carboxylesterase
VQVLLVHGALGTAAQLDALRDVLRATHDVRTLELEGHGSTPAAGADYSIRRFGDNIRGALTNRAVIFGYSMGGYAALSIAAEEPDRIAGVVTLGTKLSWSPEVAAKEVLRLDPATIRAKVPKFATDLEQRHRGAGGWETVLRKTATLMGELGARPIVDDALVQRILQPVRLMVGDRDALVPIDETAAAARKLPRGQLAVLPGTPHPIEQVRPGLIATMITDFLREITG